MLIASSKTKSFSPIKLEIVIETEEELIDLWCRVNLSIADTKGPSYNSPYKHKFEGNESHELFRVLDSYMNKGRLGNGNG